MKQNESENIHIVENSQFSLAVGLLTILTLVVVFAYISNLLRTRWKERAPQSEGKLLTKKTLKNYSVFFFF